MAGFGAMKKKEERGDAIFQAEIAEVEKQIVEAKAPTPAPVSKSNFPNLEAEFKEQTNPNRIRPSKVFCGVVGHEGTGKSGIVIDGHMHKYPEGMLWAMDFDNGAMACKEAHYPGSDERVKYGLLGLCNLMIEHLTIILKHTIV
jgi:hypothetical protein